MLNTSTPVTIYRESVSTEWAMWVEQGSGTHAVLMDAANGRQVWIETSASIATQYARQYGNSRMAVIFDDTKVSLIKFTADDLDPEDYDGYMWRSIERRGDVTFFPFGGEREYTRQYLLSCSPLTDRDIAALRSNDLDTFHHLLRISKI